MAEEERKIRIDLLQRWSKTRSGGGGIWGGVGVMVIERAGSSHGGGGRCGGYRR